MVSPSSPSPAPVSPEGETIRLIVLFGGMSAEHDVSCTTAAQVLAAVDPARYEIEAVGITRHGAFVRADEAMAALAQGARHLPPALSPQGPSTELTALVAAPSRATRTVVLPLLHGPMGEDGTVQGMLDLANVPYVGAGVLGSALAMDKAMAKTVAAAHGIPQARWLSFRECDIAADPKAVMKAVADQLGLPVFVKPANMGSSVGVSKATTETELAAAIHKA
ncbi:MAG: D-alanine--D-alanine ligase, partial [Acidimicrobiia bacterium]|nr:D-alanine--D-alanine ligase [Acidimicrobiia bacterium]